MEASRVLKRLEHARTHPADDLQILACSALLYPRCEGREFGRCWMCVEVKRGGVHKYGRVM